MRRFLATIKEIFNFERPVLLLYAALYLIGVFVGAIAAALLRNDFSDQARYLFGNSVMGSYTEIYIQQFLFFLLLFFMGMTVVGVPFLTLYPLYKGFSFGFLVALAVILSGVRGTIFGTLAFFGQNAFYTVLGFFVCHSSAKLSVALFESLKGTSRHGTYYREFKRHILCFLIIAPLLALGAAWECHVVPFLLKLI